jgi:hypothetical protein
MRMQRENPLPQWQILTRRTGLAEGYTMPFKYPSAVRNLWINAASHVTCTVSCSDWYHYTL